MLFHLPSPFFFCAIIAIYFNEYFFFLDIEEELNDDFLLALYKCYYVAL